MTLSSSGPPLEGASSGWKFRFARVLHAKPTFIVLQVLDLLTTLAAFHAGAFEVNPLVAHFTVLFGTVRGVVFSKVIAIVIAMGVKRLVWVVNLFYTGIVLWNLLVLLALSVKPH